MASGNMKDIKRRIKSVQSTMQITKAMELVASSKMRRAKERALGVRPVLQRHVRDCCASGRCHARQRLGLYPTAVRSRTACTSSSRATAVWQAATTRTCSSCAAAEMEGRNASVITIGKKAQEHYAKRQWPVAADYPGVAETMRISDTHEIVEVSDRGLPFGQGRRGFPLLHRICLSAPAGGEVHSSFCRVQLRAQGERG